MAELLEVRRLVADGHHNAFTDLLFWRGHYTLSFRKAEHLLTVPSGGDCPYCGLAASPDGSLLMSYYSQLAWLPLDGRQPTPADIFLARIRM
ncbi:MAG: hypothetical protein JXR77_03155 [Lentisphaeria bacterium]|nr:hypothetical protein [Lentisphaeria bacterium]